MMRHALEAQGHTVLEPEAETALRTNHPAVVLSDLRLPEGDGFGVLRASKELDPELPVIVMTAFGSIQDAVSAMKEGALDFLAKLETELFGHEKGAFTGANARKPGKFELAHRGTLFLDEIGDLPLSLQAKILRALEEKRFDRVGGTAPIQVDVRVVAATNRNLKAAVAARQFREDLYFRLSVFPITIPALRERAADIRTLARFFIDKYSRDLNKKPLTLSPAAEQEMQQYPWPGNVRELQNCIERAVILTEGDTIQPHHLHLSVRDAPPMAMSRLEENGPWAAFDLSGSLADVSRRAVAEVEKRKIEQVMKDAAGNRGRAAELLRVSYKALLVKLKEHGIDS